MVGETIPPEVIDSSCRFESVAALVSAAEWRKISLQKKLQVSTPTVFFGQPIENVSQNSLFE
jgi:hypothetical protein